MNSEQEHVADEYELGQPNVRVKEILHSINSDFNPEMSIPISHSGELLFVNRQGQVAYERNGMSKLVADFRSPIKISVCNGCVVVANEFGFGFRAFADGNISLAEFTSRPHNDNQCHVEMTQAEVFGWMSLVGKTPYNSLLELADSCEMVYTDAPAEESYFILLPDVRTLIQELSAAIHEKVEAENFDCLWFSFGCSLLDKLLLYLNPYSPYTSPHAPALQTSYNAEAAHVLEMSIEAARRLTFIKWPHSDCMYAMPNNLAASGFYFRPYYENTDRVTCFACNVCLVNWETTDDPMQEHMKHGRNCRFMMKTDRMNVTYNTTLSHLPFLSWSRICEQPNATFPVDQLVIGHTLPSTNWFACAVPPLAGYNKPSIFLFDLNNVAYRPIEILLDLYATCMVETMGLKSAAESGKSKEKRSFDWLHSVDEIAGGEEAVQSGQLPTYREPLCEITALSTITTFDEGTVTTRGERIVALLCTAVAVDDSRLRKSMQRPTQEEISTLNTMNSFCTKFSRIVNSPKPTEAAEIQPTRRRPFILVHHVVEFPDDTLLDPLKYTQLYNEAITQTMTADVSPRRLIIDESSTWFASAEKSESIADMPKALLEGSKIRDPPYVPLYYAPKKIAAVGIQCLRLPSEFDTTEFTIDSLVSSPNGRLIVAAVNQNPSTSAQMFEETPETPTCALVVYGWLPMLQMLAERPVTQISFTDGRRIRRVHLLGEDYFSSVSVPRKNAISTEPINSTALVLFTDGSLHLVDLDFGKILSVDIQPLKDVNLNDNGDVLGVAQNGQILNIEIFPSLLRRKGDVTEEQVISVLAAIERTNQAIEPTEQIDTRLTRLANKTPNFIDIESALQTTCVCAQRPLSVEQIAWLWSLTRADSTVCNQTTSTNGVSPFFGSGRTHQLNHNSLNQSLLGVSIETPHEFIEFSPSNSRDRNTPNSTTLTASTCQQYCVFNKQPYSDLHTLNSDASRTWQVRARRDFTHRTYVFEMSVMFGLNLSHINLTVGMAGHIRGIPDIKVTIYTPRSSHSSLSEEALELFAEGIELPGPSSGLSTENYLGMFGAKPSVLERKYERCLGPFNVSEFVDVNGKQATIQLSIAQLLLAAARAQLKDNSVEIEDGWMFQAQRFYVCVEVNERRTAQQKALQVAMQQCHSTDRRGGLPTGVVGETLQPTGSKRTRSMDVSSSGGYVPLPYKTSDRSKKNLKSRGGSSRRRYVHASNLVADAVAMTALKPYTSETTTKQPDTFLSCFEFLTVSVYRAADKQQRANMQRCLVLLDTPAHREILRIAAGIIPTAGATNQNNKPENIPYHRMIMAQLHALDLIAWLLPQWRISRDRQRTLALTYALSELSYELLHNCFVIATRTLANKTESVICELLDLARLFDPEIADEVVINLLQEMTKMFEKTQRFCFSGSLRWFTTFAQSLIKSLCLRPMNERVKTVVHQFGSAASTIVTAIGEVWRSRRSGTTSTPLFSKAVGDPVGESSMISLQSLDDVELYESSPLVGLLVVEPHLIAIAQRDARAAFNSYKHFNGGDYSNETEKESNGNRNEDSTVAVSRSFYEYSISLDPSSNGLSCKPPKIPRENGVENTKDANWLSESTPLATVYLLDELKESDLQWYEYLGMNTLEPTVYPTKKALSERSTQMRPLQTAKKTVTASDEMFVRCSPSANSINASNTQNTATPAPNTNESNSLADLLASTHGLSLFQSLSERLCTQNVHRFLIGSEQLPGLLEVERLDFSIFSSTCQLRVVDLNASSSSRTTDPTTVTATVTGNETNKPVSAFSSPVPPPTSEDLLNAIESNDGTLSPISKRAFVPAQSKNLEEKLKSKAEIYVLERHRDFVEQKKSVHTNSTDSLPPPLSTSFAVFAPTKTDTPSLYGGQTPMIVGPNFNSYEEMADDRAMTDEFLMEVEAPVTTQTEKKTGLDGHISSRRTPLYTVEMESCRSAQMLQIVLDFRNPFILTDFLIPANEIFSAVAVDGWIEDEKNGTIRFAFSTDIENRSLCLSDLPATSLVRYVRISFTIRDSRRSTVTFTLGNFYGIRFFSPWQLYACNGLWNATKYWNFEQTEDIDSELFPFIDPCANALKFALAHQELNFRDLNLFVQQLLMRYQTNVAQFKRLMKSGSPTAKRIYQQCLTDRILYNNFRTIIERSRVDMKPANAVLFTKSDQTNRAFSRSNTSNRDWLGREESSIDSAANASNSWWDATVDELRFVSSEFMSLINEIHAFLNLSQQISNRVLATEKTERPGSQVPEQVNTSIEILDLESAIRLFGCYVSDSSDAKLQAICCSYLFHLGSKSKWWPEFFPSVLQRHFVTGSSDSDVFIRLAYLCNQSVRHHDLHTPVVERLLTYMQDLISNPRTINRVVDVTQLSWLLLLLSSAFDVIVPNQRHTDRWTFVAGNPCSSYAHAPQPIENMRRYTRKIGNSCVKDQYWANHYGAFNSGPPPPMSGFGATTKELAGFGSFPSGPFFDYPPNTIASSSKNPQPSMDQASLFEMKKLSQEIRQIGKQIDMLLQNNELNSDHFSTLKKEQKTLSALMNTAAAYLQKGMSSIHDNILDKILNGGLDKNEMEVPKAPLAAEEDLEDVTDVAAKKQQNVEITNANAIRNRLIKSRRALYLLVKQAKNAQNSRSKVNSTVFPRSRRFAIRMQLPQQLVVQAIRTLIRLMSENSSILSSPTQILLFKVCAKLAVHGCRNPLSFKQIMESIENTQKLLAVVLENAGHYEYVRHAMLCFILDVVETEGPCVDLSPLAEENGFRESPNVESKSSLSKMDDDEDSISAQEAKAKRRKENPSEMEELEEKEMSPMEEETVGSASTSTFTTNIDEDDAITIIADELAKPTENGVALENPIMSPTLAVSGLLPDQQVPEMMALGENEMIHPGLLDERLTIGETPAYPFAFTLFDKPSESDVDMLIIMALLALRPIEMKNPPPYWENYRSWFIRQIGYAVCRARFDSGEPLSDLFRWLDFVLGAELEAANNCKTEGAYVRWGTLAIIHAKDFIEREFGMSGKLTAQSEKSPSHSALACAGYFGQYYSIYENTGGNNEFDDDNTFLYLDENFDDVFRRLVEMAHRPSDDSESLICDLQTTLERKRSAGKMDVTDQPEQMTELTMLCDNVENNYLTIDASEDAVHFVAIRGCMPLHKAIFTFSKLRFMQSLIQVRRFVRGLPFSQLPEPDEVKPEKKTHERSSRRRASSFSGVRKNDSNSETSSITPVVEKTRSKEKEALSDEILYNVAMNAYFYNSRACPISLGVSALISSTMSLRMNNNQRRQQAERLVSECLHRTLQRSLQRTVKISAYYDTRTQPSMESCSAFVVQALNELIFEMDPQKANQMPARTNRNGSGLFLQNLLTFFWDFQGNVIAHRTQNAVDPTHNAATFVLNEKTIANLMHFAATYEYMNELTWGQLLRALNTVDSPVDVVKDTKSYKFTQWIENSPYFSDLLRRFFDSSVGRFHQISSTKPTFGPAVANVFSRFLIIVFKQMSSNAMDILLSVITEKIRRSRSTGYVDFPLEMLSEVTALLDKMDRVCQCNPSILADFMTAVLEFVSDFFVEFQRMQRHFPDSIPTYGLSSFIANDATQIPSNVCFSVVLSTSHQRDRNAMMNDRWRAFNNGNSNTKPTKNINVVKRADILENAVRDGEVNANDQFVSLIYSFLRFSVRYVSQYRPQVLKALLNEQPKTLNLAIDTLFMFISCTNHVDDITVENFKIVTLADAVVHLLLVISENTMEDPEICRQFIRLVIKVLRSRVNSKPDSDIAGPSTAADVNQAGDAQETTLMDLPVPVLLLMKSLLRGVSRCQIFVEEGGHTFISEQLQLALDSCSQDWLANTRFPMMSRQLTALASHITGVEPSNPLLNTAVPAAIQQPSNTQTGPSSSSSRYNSATQSIGQSSTSLLGPANFNANNPQNSSNQSPPFALTCPSVSYQPSNNQSNPRPFSAHLAHSHYLQMPPMTKSFLRPSIVELDEIFNFSPVATFRSDSIAPSQLSVLTTGHQDYSKRSRNSTFTYKFMPKKQWVDVTMVLPYKIVLYEVVIQMPEKSEANSPSSIQIELSSDSMQANWTVLSCPVISDNITHYRISTHSYRFPVTGVRINFQCPTATPTMCLSQIQLLGATSVRAMRYLGNSKMFETQLMNHWVSLFARLCSRIDLPSWECAPSLSASLIKVYLGEENSTEMFRTIYELLLQLDRKSKALDSSLVLVIVDYLLSGGRICSRAYLSLAELLYASCALPTASSTHQQRFGLDNRPVHVAHSTAVNRQRHLLNGIKDLLTNLLPQENLTSEDSNWTRPEALKEISIFLWSAACVIWHNTSDDSIRYDTMAICFDVGSVVILYLAHFVLNIREPNLLHASSWMLCALARSSPKHLDSIFEKLGLAQLVAVDYSVTVMKALGKICQSATAVRYLMSRNLLNDWAKIAIEICDQEQHHRLPQLVSIVDCFNQLAVIDIVAKYFEDYENCPLFPKLLHYIRKYCASSSRHIEQISNVAPSSRLVESTISLIRRCLAFGGQHRTKVAHLVCDLLKSTYTNNQKGVNLPETFEDIVLRLIVADETITVRLTGVVNKRTETHQGLEGRMHHPLFGCNQDDRIMEIPLSTYCKDLLPYKPKPTPVKTRPMDDFILGSQLKLVFASDEVEDKEAAPPADNRPPPIDQPPVQNYPYTYNQFALQLVCAAYSTKHALNNEWSLEKIVDGLRAIGRFNHRHTDSVSFLEKCLRDDEDEQMSIATDEPMDIEVNDELSRTSMAFDSPRPMTTPEHVGGNRPSKSWQSPNMTPRTHSRTSLSVDPKAFADEGDYTDGYFTLTLRVKASLQTNIMNAVEDESMLAEFLKNLQPLSSTLFEFAHFGGLKLLAQSVDILSRVDAKLQILAGMMTQLSEAQYGVIKREIANARRSLAKSPLKSNGIGNTPGTSQLNDPYSSLYQAMEEPILKVYNAFQMLQERGVQLENTDKPTQSTGHGAQAKSNNYSTAAFAALQYEPAIFDSMETMTMTAADEEELMSMVDFMNSGEVFVSSPNKPPKTSGQVYSYVASIDDEWPTNTPSILAGSNFNPVSSASLYLPPPSTLVVGGDSVSKSEIFGQLSSQLTEFANKFQNLQSSVQESLGTYVLKLPVTLPLKRFQTARSTASSTATDQNLEYVLVALSLFLEIESYGEMLVTYDKTSAKKLIYLMLGMDSPATPKQRLVDGLQPLLPQSLLGGLSGDLHSSCNEIEREEIVRTIAGRLTDRLSSLDVSNRNDSEMERLMLVPFLVLSSCFEHLHPRKHNQLEAEKVRLYALENGTMDVILTLLSYFGHQKPAKTPIRATGELVVTQLVTRLISLTSDIQSIFGLFNAIGGKPTHRRASTAALGNSAAPGSGTQNTQTSSSNPNYMGFSNAANFANHNTANSNDGQFWAKGTGFGSGSTSVHWNLANHVAKRKQHEVTVTCLLNILTNYVKRQTVAATSRLVASFDRDNSDTKNGQKKHQLAKLASTHDEPSPFTTIPGRFVQMVERSCLNSILNSYIMNDSVLDISRHVMVYESVVGLILSFCSSVSVAREDEQTNIEHMSDLILEADANSGFSVYDRLKKLCGCVEIYMSKLRKSASSTNDPNGHQEENLGDLLEVAQQAIAVMVQRDEIRRDQNRDRFGPDENEEQMEEQRQITILDENGYTTGQPLEVVYNNLMRPLQFESIAFFASDGVTPLFPYLYSGNLASSSHGVVAKRTRRLAQEIVTLSTSLPLSMSSSVFLRTADERLDVMKVLITGPVDTPYSGGCFEFDVAFPENYPSTPMNMNLQTTGNRTVRFNPNLYEEGKVCLSILNTWSGRPEERWNAETSSFLQVLVSIQSLIFVNEPYFNEPGFERSRGTPAGDQSSRDYTANIRHQCIRWAMLDMLRKPPPAFAKVVRRHFWLKRDEICLQIHEWIRETREFVEKNSMVKSMPQHLVLLEKNFTHLLNEFHKMECPSPDLAHIESKYVKDYFAQKQ